MTGRVRVLVIVKEHRREPAAQPSLPNRGEHRDREHERRGLPHSLESWRDPRRRPA